MKNSITQLHHQADAWLRDAGFYRDELIILNNRLAEVASKNTSQEVLAHVEHFQNKFIITKERLDTLVHGLHIEEDKLEGQACQIPNHIHQGVAEPDKELNEQMKTFVGDFAALRLEFNTFLSRVM
jgi:hypothetical protein